VPPNETLLNQTFVAMGVVVGDIPALVDAVKDWVDADDLTINGAESDDYQRLNPPYDAKNKPMDDLSELLLVRGITPRRYSDKYDGLPQVDRSGRPIKEPEYPFRLEDVWTPLSSGRVNINTAPVSVLTIIFNGDDQAAERVDATRRTTPAGSPTCPDARTLLLNSGFSQQVAEELQARVFIVKSTVFKASIHIKGTSRRFHAILGRGNTPQDWKVLSFYWQEEK